MNWRRTFPSRRGTLLASQILNNRRKVAVLLDLLTCSQTFVPSQRCVYAKLFNQESGGLNGLHDEKCGLRIFISKVDRHVELGYECAQEVEVVVTCCSVEERVTMIVLLRGEAWCLAKKGQ